MKIIPFPERPKPPAIDWQQVEAEKNTLFPNLPPSCLEILRRIVDGRDGDYDVEIFLSDADAYPRSPIRLYPFQWSVIWTLDIIDRFGARMVHDNLLCEVIREEKRLPLFLVEQLSVNTYDALSSTFGHEFEYYMKASDGLFLGKDVPETDMLVVMARLVAEDIRYALFMDKITGNIVWNQMTEGLAFDDVLTL